MFVSALSFGLDYSSFPSGITQYSILFCTLKKKKREKNCYCSSSICVADGIFFGGCCFKQLTKKLRDVELWRR